MANRTTFAAFNHHACSIVMEIRAYWFSFLLGIVSNE